MIMVLAASIMACGETAVACGDMIGSFCQAGMLRTARLVAVPGLSTAFRSRSPAVPARRPEARRPCVLVLWKCAKCSRVGITNLTLARAHFVSYTVVAKPRTDHFRRGETRPIACLVRIA